MTTISLDMSTTCVGISVWNDDDELLYYTKIKADKKMKWYERVSYFYEPLKNIIKRYKVDHMMCEDVPLVSKGKYDMTANAKATFVKLGAMRGLAIAIAAEQGLIMEKALDPCVWRSNIGILKGKKDRDTKKVMAIKLVNEMFGINLKCEFTKSGKYSEEKSDDDIADSILLYCSTREKYRQKVG